MKQKTYATYFADQNAIATARQYIRIRIRARINLLKLFFTRKHLVAFFPLTLEHSSHKRRILPLCESLHTK